MKEVVWNPEFGTGGTIICKCDLCEKTVKYKFKAKPSFKQTQEKLKSKGWLARKINDVWHDFCSEDCFEQFEDKED